ncbi:MAG: nucleoside hydrolase [Alistipes sp.]|nr:nucleoside hydrolase [Alistipes sp.]
MKRLLFTLVALFAFAAADAAKPIKIIFDTDMGNDVDDVIALDMLYKYQDEGTIDLLGILSSKREGGSVKLIDAMNTLYGYPNIPVGIAKIYPEENYVDTSTSKRLNYADWVVANYNYKHTIKDWNAVPDGYKLLRQLLAKEEDHSVVVVAVGFSTNLARMMESKGDEFSPLGGKELFAQKVEKVVIMAGNFSEQKPEYNVRKDHFAAVKFYAECPVPMYFTDYRLGRTILYPWQCVYKGFKYAENHPFVTSFEYYQQMPYNRPLWDPTAVLFAAEPKGGYASISKPGMVQVDFKSSTFFIEDKGSNRYYYIVNDKQRAKIIRRVEELTMRTPKCFNK